MSDTNMVLLEGNITQDLELQESKAGNAYVRFSVAVNKSRRNTSGEWENEGHFFDVTAFGSVAENLVATATKGTRVLVTGRLNHDRWENEEGEKRSKVTIVAEAVAPSLRFATASVTRQSKNGSSSPASDSTVDQAIDQLEEAFGPM